MVASRRSPALDHDSAPTALITRISRRMRYRLDARLEPYGMHNDRPRFLAGGVQLVGAPKRVGTGERHLRFQVRQNGTSLWAIAFGMGERCDELTSDGGHCCLAFTPQLNEWQGQRSVQLEVHDFQPCRNAPLLSEHGFSRGRHKIIEWNAKFFGSPSPRWALWLT